MTTKALHLNPKSINISVNLPASKSISNRALILNALAYSAHEIENLSDCDDTRVMLKALDSNDNTFDIGAAGTAMRFLTAFLAKTVGEWVITGSERMKQRPIKLLVDALNSLGAKIEYLEKTGFPPLKIYGSALLGGTIRLNGGVSSQYISALMMIGPYMQNGLKIILEGTVISAPYIHMTLRMMQDYGVVVDFKDNTIVIQPQAYKPIQYKAESDWSAASYWYEILSIAGKGQIFLKGLNKHSYQGDSKVAELFDQLGVETTYQTSGVMLIANGKTCSEFEYDFTDQPDLAQTFAVTCCLKNIPFLFKGVQSLKIKETDRVAALINELKKLRFVLTEPVEGELAWNGTRIATNDAVTPTIKTYDDHRMAMAFAPVALIRPIIIEHPDVVSKSYPTFWEDIAQISTTVAQLYKSGSSPH
ncbi:MAG: 3-phosphoshikimate 1-carboxyvinyltransferase [Paludibacter sp.]|nr:3-phosphoshikimate 1-carboxyvinyltransferase [Paludibacter sp.]